MKPIGTILAAVDFSESSNFAFKAAVGLAKLFSVELHEVHAFEAPLPLFSSYGLSIPPDFISEARDAAARKLEKSCQTATAAGVSVKSHLGTAPAAGAIADMARRLGADLIVMGTRGQTGVKHLLLGSVAEHTVRDAPCSVLTVKGGGIAAMKTIEKIVVAVDFSEHADQALDVAVEFAKQLGAELHLVHALDVRIALMTPYEVAIPTAFIEEARNAAASKLKVLVEKVAAEGVRATSQLSGVPAASAIVDLAEELEADLIVMGTRGYTGLKHVLLGSVAERTLRQAPCSVLTVKESSG
jgi:nucleotide-binding universal stress UspA family protein